MLINLAAIASGEEASKSHYWRRYNDLWRQYTSILTRSKIVSAEPADIANDMWASYKSVFGDPEDPEYKAKIQQVLDQWARERQEAS